MRKITIVGLFLFSLSVLAAGGGSSVGPGNPAAIFCVQQGYRLIGVTDVKTGGGNGLCQVGDGTVGEWTFWRAKKGTEAQLASQAFFGGQTSCEEAGGTQVLYQAFDRTPFSTCLFSDSSEIELNTLEGGPAGSPQLAAALQGN